MSMFVNAKNVSCLQKLILTYAHYPAFFKCVPDVCHKMRMRMTCECNAQFTEIIIGDVCSMHKRPPEDAAFCSGTEKLFWAANTAAFQEKFWILITYHGVCSLTHTPPMLICPVCRRNVSLLSSHEDEIILILTMLLTKCRTSCVTYWLRDSVCFPSTWQSHINRMS